jgi:hypothetical protein
MTLLLGYTAFFSSPAISNNSSSANAEDNIPASPKQPSSSLPDQHNNSSAHLIQPISPSRSSTPWTSWITLLLCVCLFLGAALQLLAQFLGVLAFTVNATPTPLQAAQGNTFDFGASTWILDVALTSYASCAWVFALFAAGLVGFVWRVPRLGRLA